MMDPGEAQDSLVRAPAVFQIPAAIDLDLESKTTPEAQALLQDAIALCRPRRPGFTLAAPRESELATLADRCRALGAALPVGAWTERGLVEKDRAFDDFFGIVRSASPDAFVTGVATGVIAMLEEFGRPHSLVPAESDALAHGFYRLAASVSPAFVARPSLPRADDAGLQRPRDAMERWRNGHLIFVALTGGLIFQQMRAVAALEQGDTSAAVAALADARCLFVASAAALRLAGDMTPAEYDSVRAHMSPPRVPEGFSGLFDADHRRMLHLTKRLGVLLLREDCPKLSWAREGYWLALNDSYSAHRWVCERLIGQAPSLNGVAASDERPAHEALEGFAKRALALGGFPTA